MEQSKGKGSGLTNNGMMNPGTGPNQDGFNHPSHVTDFGEGPATSPQVGRGDAGDTDSRGKGTSGVVGDSKG